MSGMLNVFIVSGYIISSITFIYSYMTNFNWHEFKIRNNYRKLQKNFKTPINWLTELLLIISDV